MFIYTYSLVSHQEKHKRGGGGGEGHFIEVSQTGASAQALFDFESLDLWVCAFRFSWLLAI